MNDSLVFCVFPLVNFISRLNGSILLIEVMYIFQNWLTLSKVNISLLLHEYELLIKNQKWDQFIEFVISFAVSVSEIFGRFDTP